MLYPAELRAQHSIKPVFAFLVCYSRFSAFRIILIVLMFPLRLATKWLPVQFLEIKGKATCNLFVELS